VVNNERIALDIDEPSDVERLLECRKDTESVNLLIDIGIGKRLVSRKDNKDSQRAPG